MKLNIKRTIAFFVLLNSLAFFSSAQTKNIIAADVTTSKHLSDNALLDLVQKQTFHYFWQFAHPVSGLARERSNVTKYYGNEVVTMGGSGFGIMAIIVATKHNWIKRDSAVARMLKILHFLQKADSYHGIFPHWMNGATGKTIPFSKKDDGADIVETSYLFEGLLCARQYFNSNNKNEKELRQIINVLWKNADWNWHTQGQEELYWHWSPDNGWAMNHPIHGWNECLITFIMSASSPQHSIDSNVYHKGWATGDYFKNGKEFYGIKLPLGFDYGGPLFFSQYTFMAIDPHRLKDEYADYWQQNLDHTLINYHYCVDNPKKYRGYGKDCWGLTASDSYNGYDAHSPTNDLGVISPTAALSAFPYTPKYSMQALKHFYYDLGNKIWGQYGFTDAFDETKGWQSQSDLAIDEGPIIVMIENYRSALLWKLFMNCPEIKNGLKKLGFESPYLKN